MSRIIQQVETRKCDFCDSTSVYDRCVVCGKDICGEHCLGDLSKNSQDAKIEDGSLCPD
jgi:hypothetical protein